MIYKNATEKTVFLTETCLLSPGQTIDIVGEPGVNKNLKALIEIGVLKEFGVDDSVAPPTKKTSVKEVVFTKKKGRPPKKKISESKTLSVHEVSI